METKVEEQKFIDMREEARAVLTGEFVRCRGCGKLFKPYKVKTFDQEAESTICEECREKYS